MNGCNGVGCGQSTRRPLPAIQVELLICRKLPLAVHDTNGMGGVELGLIAYEGTAAFSAS